MGTGQHEQDATETGDRQEAVQASEPRKHHLRRYWGSGEVGRASNHADMNSPYGMERVWPLPLRQRRNIQEFKLNRKMMKLVFWKVYSPAVNRQQQCLAVRQPNRKLLCDPGKELPGPN